MFIKMYDTLINADYIVRVNPIHKGYQDGEERYIIVMEMAFGSKVEGRRFTYIDKTEAEETLQMIEEKLL